MRKFLKAYKNLLKRTKDLLISYEELRRLYVHFFYPKYLIGVNFIAFNKNKEVLLARHSWREKYKWRVPGGLVERKEGLRIALVREIKEELGLDINGNHLSFIEAVRNKGFPRIDIYLLYNRYIKGDLKPGSEIKELSFFKTLLLPTSLFPGQAEIVERSIQLLSAKD